jgi:hypothetical protein
MAKMSVNALAARPQRKIIANANQLGVDTQLLAHPQDGTFDYIIRP